MKPFVYTVVVTTTFLFARGNNFNIDGKKSKIDEKKDRGATPIRIMTFNTWISGSIVNDGLRKVARHIAKEKVDIVGLQEFNQKDTENLTRYLTKQSGRNWTAGDQYWDTVVFTKHRVLQTNTSDLNSTAKNSYIRTEVEVRKNKSILIWNLHLDYNNYGPYIACNKELQHKMNFLIHQKGISRSYQVIRMRQEKQFQADLDSRKPMIVMGDFNEPSHFDWVNSTAKLHCGKVFKWPTSEYLTTFGFVDAYRETNTNPLTHLGITWSPVYSDTKPMTVPWDFRANQTIEPRDRIDFIYFRKETLKVKSCRTYHGEKKLNNFEPNPLWKNHTTNDWPSDHSSVICDFYL